MLQHSAGMEGIEASYPPSSDIAPEIIRGSAMDLSSQSGDRQEDEDNEEEASTSRTLTSAGSDIGDQATGNAEVQEVGALNTGVFDGSDSPCHPKCTWQCQSPKCSEVCEPVCQPPRCETRCQGPDISRCDMVCGKPHCAVVCPKHSCPTSDCPACKTVCTDPMCRLQCPGTQPCRNVCEQPRCEWNCKAPEECPAPACHMVCENARSCPAHETYKQLPPLEPGESAVESFKAQSQQHQQVLPEGFGPDSPLPTGAEFQHIPRVRHKRVTSDVTR